MRCAQWAGERAGLSLENLETIRAGDAPRHREGGGRGGAVQGDRAQGPLDICRRGHLPGRVRLREGRAGEPVMPRALEGLGQTVKKDAYTGLSLDSESRMYGRRGQRSRTRSTAF